jgi:hypothetical protein
MALKISREAQFGAGSRGFWFELCEDEALDRSIFDAGVRHEDARFQPGSLGQKIFERLSSARETNGEKPGPEKS